MLLEVHSCLFYMCFERTRHILIRRNTIHSLILFLFNPNLSSDFFYNSSSEAVLRTRMWELHIPVLNSWWVYT